MIEKYCSGCGVKLQDENVLDDGYTTSLENDICQRCFRMKNYGEYKTVTKTNEEYIEILKSINSTKDLVLYVVDILNLDQDFMEIRKYIQNKILLVINKRDVLPKSIKNEKIINYVKEQTDFFEDIVIISSEKNYNIDYLLNRIKFFQTTSDVYVVGKTNSGKSTLINKLLKNYSNNPQELTISPMPSTTLDKISIPLNENLTLIDTPGLVDNGNILNFEDPSLLKNIIPKKEIKPKVYQMKKNQCLIIDNLVRIDYFGDSKNSFVVYVSNNLKVKRYNATKCTLLKDLNKKTYDMNHYEDIVINGLGFVKITDKCQIDVYIDQKVDVYTRKSLI